MTEDCPCTKCYSLKWVPGEYDCYAQVKGQGINDNCLSSDREATSHLPTLALILPARVAARHSRQPCPGLCKGHTVCNMHRYPRGMVLRGRSLSLSSCKRRWTGLGRKGNEAGLEELLCLSSRALVKLRIALSYNISPDWAAGGACQSLSTPLLIWTVLFRG